MMDISPSPLTVEEIVAEERESVPATTLTAQEVYASSAEDEEPLDANARIVALEAELARERARNVGLEQVISDLSMQLKATDLRAESLASELHTAQKVAAAAEQKAEALAAELEIAQNLRDREPERKQIAALEESNQLLKEQLKEAREARESAEVWHPASLASALTSYVWDASKKAYKAVSTASAHLTLHTRASEGSYTTLEQEQMITVHVYYKKFIAPEVPPVLRMENDYYLRVRDPNLVPKRRTFNLREWSYRMGDGPLREFAIALCEAICTYQQERDNRNYGMVGTGYLDDPTNLMLAELKMWLSDELSSMALTEESLGVLGRRRRYVDELLRADIFPSGERSKITLKYVLQDAKSTLERAEATAAKALAGPVDLPPSPADPNSVPDQDWAVL